MLTKIDRASGEARIEYMDADFRVVARGDFVVCAVTGRKIPLPALRYWSVERQEAYVDAAAAHERLGPGEAKP